MSLALFDSAIIIPGLVSLLLVWAWLRRKQAAFPPGPDGWPLIGNVLDVPKEREWEVFAQLARKYGNLFSLSILGRPYIIINSLEVMEELEKKGSNFSDRPVLPMAGVMLKFDQTLVLAHYGPRWRTFRKYFTRAFGPGKPIQTMYPLIIDESRQFIQRVLAKPQAIDLLAHCHKFAKGTILRAAYGYRMQEEDDPYVKLMEKAGENFTTATKPGNFLVNIFPILLKFPEWAPGTGFRKIAQEWRKETDMMVELPYANCLKGLASGETEPCFVRSVLEGCEGEITEEDHYNVKWTAAAMYGAGSESTAATVYVFFLAMTLYPDIQKKAQSEIDAVVGSGRLPDFDDRNNLPYVNAVITELLRWGAPGLMSLPHTSLEDDTLSGYFIPKNAIITSNIWAMARDPSVYPDPSVFDPTRFIEAPGEDVQYDPRKIIFGFARRICPGNVIAESSLYSAIVHCLATLDIQKALDESTGDPIVPVYEYTTDHVFEFPKFFQCSITPRSQSRLL